MSTEAQAILDRYHIARDASMREAFKSISDVREVVDFDGPYLMVRPEGASGSPERIARLDHVSPAIGDLIMVQKLAGLEGQWIAVGGLTGRSAGTGTSLGEPILIDPVIRNADDPGGDTWDSTTGVGLVSLLDVVEGLDPGLVYYVHAEVGAYLAAHTAGVRVQLAAQIGFSTEEGSKHATQPFGAGHRFAALTWCEASYERIIGARTSVQIAAVAKAATAGTNTIGDGHLHIRLIPVIAGSV